MQEANAGNCYWYRNGHEDSGPFGSDSTPWRRASSQMFGELGFEEDNKQFEGLYFPPNPDRGNPEDEVFRETVRGEGPYGAEKAAEDERRKEVRPRYTIVAPARRTAFVPSATETSDVEPFIL